MTLTLKIQLPWFCWRSHILDLSGCFFTPARVHVQLWGAVPPAAPSQEAHGPSNPLAVCIVWEPFAFCNEWVEHLANSSCFVAPFHPIVLVSTMILSWVSYNNGVWKNGDFRSPIFIVCRTSVKKSFLSSFKRYYLFFLDRWEGKEKERERIISVWLLVMCLLLGTRPGPQPRHVPWLGTEPATL